MNKVTIFTDGASKGNPGPGGWGAIVIFGVISDQHVKEIGGHEENTTNNRMELRGAIESLRNLEKISLENSEITIYADSEYVVKGITIWIKDWVRKGWKTAARKPVLNKDLWEELLAVSEGKNIVWKTVLGHAGNVGNERADEIATGFADKNQVKLFEGSVEGYPFKIV